MSPICLKLPPGATSRGVLNTAPALSELREDMLDIALPTGIRIDVGWWPAWDPTGEFVVTVYASDWDHPIEQFFTKDLNEMIEAVEERAVRFSQDVSPVDSSTSTRLESHPTTDLPVVAENRGQGTQT